MALLGQLLLPLHQCIGMAPGLTMFGSRDLLGIGHFGLQCGQRMFVVATFAGKAEDPFIGFGQLGAQPFNFTRQRCRIELLLLCIFLPAL